MGRTVLVVGANGRLGRAAVQAFSAAGWRVIAQARRGPRAGLPEVTPLATPLEDTAALAQQAAGARVLVHAVNPVYTRWQAEALPAARASMDLALRLGATFMLPGNVYNFGQGMPPLLLEDTPQAPTTSKGRIRCAMEAELAARAGDGLDSMVIRAGDFFGGDGAGTWIDLVIARSLRAGRLVWPGPPDSPHAWAYLPDLARAFVAVAARCADEAEAGGRAQARRLHFAGHTLTGVQMLDAIERAARGMGLVPATGLRRVRMPWTLLRLAAPFVPMWREVLEMAYLWRVPHALSGEALSRFAGPLPQTPVDEAVPQALRDLGVAGAAPG